MHERQVSSNSDTPEPGQITPSKVRKSTGSSSPTISRYGRSHKPKLQNDFVSIDKKVSAYLKISPKNQMQFYSAPREPKKKASPKKTENAEETPKKRGRPPKTPTLNTSGSEDVTKIVIKTEPQDPASPVEGCEWMVGDLAWGRVGGHPFWPCVIALDPLQKIFTKFIRKGRHMVSTRWLHVQFFGDNGRRSWLNCSAVMSFNGREAFLHLRDTCLAGIRKRDPKQSSAFIVKPAVIQVWEKAVQEAEDLVNASREERTEFFRRHFPPPLPPKLSRDELIERVLETPDTPQQKKRGRKRKADLSPTEEDVSKKQIKLEPEEPKLDVSPETVNPLLSSTPRTIADRKKRQALLMQLARTNQTPPTPVPLTPPSITTVEAAGKTPAVKRLSTSELQVSVEKKKPKKKYVKKKPGADFQAYCSKNFDRVSDDHPELNEKEVNKYLQKLWDEMNETQRARYHSRFQGVEKEESESAEETSENLEGSTEENEEENRSSKSPSPAPLAVATQKSTTAKRIHYKYLFAGTKSEKVCQICEKAGETVRCRGPCQGYYHPLCVTNPPAPTIAAYPTSTPRGKKGRKRLKKSLGKSPASVSDQSPASVSEQSPASVSHVSLKEDIEDELPTDSQENLKEDKEQSEQNGVDMKEEESVGSPNGDVLEPIGASKVRKASKDSESGSSEEGEGFKCKDCQEGRSQPCFVCHEFTEKKTGDTKLYRCTTAYCGKVYHEDCLKAWPQSSWRANGNGKLGVVTCPQHTCHTCASDNPGVIKARYSNDKLVRCIRCPTTYHYGNYCVPAGSEILTNTQIICPQHYQPRRAYTQHVNAAWCFICASGGSLICCDLCPTAFHADCLNLTDPPNSYICEDCLTGRFPLYGEIVWVKLGAYRWWPAEILYPLLIPDNILNLPHVRGEFAVRFFGSHDHYWVNRGRVFLYQDGDTAGKGNYKKSSVDQMFERAVKEASEAQRKYLEEKATREAENRPGMKPPNYVKLKANRPVGSVRTIEMNLSSLTPCECDPNTDNPCAPDSDCLNRILMVECNPLVCPAGVKCCNQLFEKRQYPPLQPYQTQARGWGLKTLVALKKGDFVIEYVGEMIDEEEYKKRLTHMHENNEENFYFLTIDKDRLLDAGPKGNVARFMNHSCQPNCETQKWTVNGDTRVGLFALDDIPANTELVFNYNLESIGTDKKPCMCGAPNCSGFIGVKAIKTQDKEENKEKKVVKKKKVVVSKTHDEVCFVCGEGGELLLCDGKLCTKGYHLSCLGKKQRPQGYWLCPWHQCNVCNKGRVRRCALCVNSYCQDHSEGNIKLDPLRGLLCSTHNQEKASSPDVAQLNHSTAKTEIPMEVDEVNSESSTLASSQNSVTKVEPTNNNVIKSKSNNPGRRSRRSRSDTSENPSPNVVVNGVTRRRGRPSSVDEKLIVSFKKTENSVEKSSKVNINGVKSEKVLFVEELINHVIDSLPIKENIPLDTIKEDIHHEDLKKGGEKNMKRIEMLDLNRTEDAEMINPNVANEKSTEKNVKGIEEKGVCTVLVQEVDEKKKEDSIEKSKPEVNEKNASGANTELLVTCDSDSKINMQDNEPKTENKTKKNDELKLSPKFDALNQNGEVEGVTAQGSQSETKKENCVGLSGKKVVKITKVVKSASQKNSNVSSTKFKNENFTKEKSLKKTVQEKNIINDKEKITVDVVVDKTQNFAKVDQDCSKSKSANEISSNTSVDTNKGLIGKPDSEENNLTPANISDIDKEVDDFELSYSENSSDQVIKSINESSIEMKVTDCTSENGMNREMGEINVKSDLVNSIEKSNAMEVA